MTRTAIVLAGAGARGAYEVGVLSVLLPRLAEEGRGQASEIVVIGTSAGAINAAILAGFEDPTSSLQAAVELWTSICVADVFTGLRTTAVRDVTSYLFQILGLRGHLDSLLDSSPLRATMEHGLDWAKLHETLERGTGWVSAVGVVTTACNSGRTVIFVDGKGVETPPADVLHGIDYVRAQVAVPHVLASAAIPGAFLPVAIEHPSGCPAWYVDGGVRLNCPILPALALGADRVVIVATTPDPDQRVAAPVSDNLCRPDVFDAAGVAMHAILVDRMAEDVRTLRRTNAFLKARRRSPRSAAKTMPPHQNGVANRTRADRHRIIPNLYVGPPQSGIISATANRILRERQDGWTGRLSDLGVLGLLVGGSSESHGELLSFLLFDVDFLAALIDLGKAHAEAALGAARDLPWRDNEQQLDTSEARGARA
jgi:NTE family protein